MKAERSPILSARFIGCLLGGAAGDAAKDGSITGNTQLTLFTAEGLIRGAVRFHRKGIGGGLVAVVSHSYLRWLTTQEIKPAASFSADGWLIAVAGLHTVRETDPTTSSVLRNLTQRGVKASNQARGYGGVVRAAPVGIFLSHRYDNPEGHKTIFNLGCEIAWLTHGHPDGYLPAGCLALLVAGLCREESLEKALEVVLDVLRLQEGHAETLEVIVKVLHIHALTAGSQVSPESLRENFGSVDVAGEVFAQALLLAMAASAFDAGLRAAAMLTQSNCAVLSIVGNILGARWGVEAISSDEWLEGLEDRDAIATIASDLAAGEWELQSEAMWQRYPGH